MSATYIQGQYWHHPQSAHNPQWNSPTRFHTKKTPPVNELFPNDLDNTVMEKLMIPSNTSVRDFGYPNDHPLHNGVVDSDLEGAEYDEVDGASSYEEGQYSSDEINRKAVALFDFIPENDNEVALREGQLIWISYRHGQGWLVAEDPETGENGLVPEEYVEIWYDDVEEEEEDDHVPGVDSVEENKDVEDDVPKRFLPDILHYEEDEWVDTDDEDDPHLLPHPQSSHIRPKEEVVIE